VCAPGAHHGAVTEQDPHSKTKEPPGKRRDWRAVLVGVLLGGMVGDAAVNILSGDYRWRFVILITAAGLVLAIPVWLSRYPHSLLVTWSTRALLAGAVAAAGLAAFSRPPVSSWEITAAALLTTGAVFIPAEANTRIQFLTGVAMIAFGVAIIGLGVGWLADNDRLGGVTGIATGVATVGLGVGLLAGNGRLGGIAVITGGMVLVGFGVGLLADNDRLGGVQGIIFGVAVVGLGVGWLAGNGRLEGIAGITVGVAAVGLGVGWLADNDRLEGIAGITAGAAAVGLGVGWLADNDRLEGIAGITGGLAIIGLDVGLLADNNRLEGIAGITVGVAIIGGAVITLLDDDLKQRLRHRWTALTTDRDTVQATRPSTEPEPRAQESDDME
jgi:hypothetical protein